SHFPPAEPAAASRICTASRHLHRHYRMRRKRRAARPRPPSGGPQFNVRTLARRKVRFMQTQERRRRVEMLGCEDASDSASSVSHASDALNCLEREEAGTFNARVFSTLPPRSASVATKGSWPE